MKNILTILAAACLLGGCSSYCVLAKNDLGATTDCGEQHAGLFFVLNVSYQLLGFIPWTSGTTWQYGPYEKANDNSISWFCDEATIDNNLKAVKCAMKETGATRVADLTTHIEDNSTWSLFLCNRHIVKTTCTLLK